MKCCVYMPYNCFKMSYNVARQVTYLTHIIILGMLYSTIHGRWCRKGEKNYLLGSLLSSLFHWSMFLPQQVDPPSLPSCVIQFLLIKNMVYQLPWSEMRSRSRRKDENSRHAAGLPRCVVAVRGYLDTHRMNAGLGLLNNGKSMVLETRGPWEFEKI